MPRGGPSIFTCFEGPKRKSDYRVDRDVTTITPIGSPLAIMRKLPSKAVYIYIIRENLAINYCRTSSTAGVAWDTFLNRTIVTLVFDNLRGNGGEAWRIVTGQIPMCEISPIPTGAPGGPPGGENSTQLPCLSP